MHTQRAERNLLTFTVEAFPTPQMLMAVTIKSDAEGYKIQLSSAYFRSHMNALEVGTGLVK